MQQFQNVNQELTPEPKKANFRKSSLCARFLEHMQSGGTLSEMENQKWQCTSITQRMHDLRKAGYNVVSTPKTSKNGVKYVEFSIPAPVQPELNFIQS